MKKMTLETWRDQEVDAILLGSILCYSTQETLEDVDKFTDALLDTYDEVEDCYSISKDAVIDLFERMHGEQEYNNPKRAEKWRKTVIEHLNDIEGDWIIVKETDKAKKEPKVEKQKNKNPKSSVEGTESQSEDGKKVFNFAFKELKNGDHHDPTGDPLRDDPKYGKHQQICNNLHKTYVQKNQAYGDSFAESVKKFGLVAAATRMEDKHNRIVNLIQNPNVDKGDESLKDSLLDLANYCIMTAMILDDPECKRI